MNTKYLVAALAMIATLGSRAGNTDDKDSLGLPGDNLDLYGVMELFKAATSLEEFEKALNTESNHVNNLDLNEDNETDYIRVSDFTDSSAHAIILQIPVSATESQDVAVIELESPAQETANIQIIGDEELYGADYIVEPCEETDDKFAMEKNIRIVVNVWTWPCVRFVYAPVYRPWVSPWKWRAYPKWWSPWRPVAWHIHWGHVHHYRHVHYHRVYVYRGARAHRYYHNHRMTSAAVHTRYAPAHKHYQKTHKTQHQMKTNHKVKNQPKNQPAKKGQPKQKAQPKGGKGGKK